MLQEPGAICLSLVSYSTPNERKEALLTESGWNSVEALIEAEQRSDEARIIDNDLRQIHENTLIAGDGKTTQELEKAAENADPDQIAAKIQEAATAHSVLDRFILLRTARTRSAYAWLLAPADRQFLAWFSGTVCGQPPSVSPSASSALSP
jgi:hypothetical protein